MEPSFTPFTYLMIFLGVAVVIIIILLLTINWNSSSTPSTNTLPTSQVVAYNTNPVDQMNYADPVVISSINVTDIIDKVDVTNEDLIQPAPVVEETPVIDKLPEPSNDMTFSNNSTRLLESLFESIDSIVIKQSEIVDHDQQVKDAAKVLANSLCDVSNADTLVKSYVNLNELLKEYTKVSRDKYLDRSALSELSSGIDDDRSVSPSMLSVGTEGSNSLADIKRQAGILTMIINGIYFKCLDLSSGSNDNFKTYLRTLNTMLFRYSELSASSSWKDAKIIKQEALKVASGAILTNQSD